MCLLQSANCHFVIFVNLEKGFIRVWISTVKCIVTTLENNSLVFAIYDAAIGTNEMMTNEMMTND